MKENSSKPARAWTPMRIVCTAGVLIFIAALILAVYMMANNMGAGAGELILVRDNITIRTFPAGRNISCLTTTTTRFL